MARFLAWLNRERAAGLVGYDELWRWSVTDLEGFWTALRDWFAVHAALPTPALPDPSAPQPTWFPGARLNWAESVLCAGADPDEPAVIGLGGPDTAPEPVSWRDLARQVASVAATLRTCGVVPGDRVAAALPNVPKAVVAMLATAAVGAVWVPPEASLRPKVIFATVATAELAAALPGPPQLVRIDVAEFGAADAGPAPTCAAVPFAHPLRIGDGGVQSHGGVLLETLRRDGLHHDTGPGDRVFGCLASAESGWAALAVGATVVTCAGPAPSAEALLRACAAHRVTRLDIGADHLAACARSGVHAPERHDLSALRTVVTTAAAPVAAWQWVHAHVKRDVLLGVDLFAADGATVLVGTNPLLPLYAGELQAPALGVRVAQHASGALVATTPQPASTGPAGYAQFAIRVSPTPYGSYRVLEGTEGTDHGSADRTR